MIHIFTVIAILWLILGLFNMCQGVASHFDGKKWKEGSVPDLNATIVDVTSEKVQYTKNNAKFLTVVEFSDGFLYSTHDTERVNHIGTYTISVNREKVLVDAVLAHTEAVNRFYEKEANKQ